MRSVVRENAASITTFVLICIIIGFIILNAINQMLDSEIRFNDSNQKISLNTSKKIVEIHFTDIKNNILFLSSIPSLKTFAYGNYRDMAEKEDIAKNLQVLMANHKEIYKLRIVDGSGNEVLTAVNSSYDPRNIRGFKMAEIATPITDIKGAEKGELNATVSVFNMLRLLPDNIFIINDTGNAVTFNSDESVETTNLHYNILGRNGKIYLSKHDTLHYVTANITSEINILLGTRSNEEFIKKTIYERATIPVILTILFISLLILLAYLNISRFKELIGAQKIIIHSLADTTEWRDKTTGRHLNSTKEYAVLLSKHMRKKSKYRKTIDKDFLVCIADASPLHDIGKVATPDSVLLKPGRLSDEEFNIIKKHVFIGKQLLQNDIEKFTTKQPFFEIAKNICAYHHEKYNGKGYIGIKGDKIPLEARIFALCDVYDALRSKRHYKDEMSHEKAVEIIKSERGEHFDPDVVDAFLECQEYFNEISELNKV
ncbi:MAG: HD domain-containing protein [Nitrospirae bacterium]|nr:HD domain-containing protein [Nitrospirota bacterium]